MKIAIITIGLCWVGLFALLLTNRHTEKATPPPACTCGPTCPTPAPHSWPIPASMTPVKR